MIRELYFCTSFDSNYLARGLALCNSLVQHARSFEMWVLCLDNSSYDILRKLALPCIHPISMSDFERGDKELLRAKNNRSRIEYYFTCTASMILFILRNNPNVDVITYLDSDLFFFSDPSPLFEELGGGSTLIIAHSFPKHLKHFEVYGVYNVSLLTFRRDENALQCLRWWRDRCLEWCYDRVEEGRFADQKYLDEWPTRFRGVVVLKHKGAGLAPWNITNYRLELENGRVTVDSQPLVFFHFHSLKKIARWLYDPRLAPFGVRPNSLIRREIYGPYIRELRSVEKLNPGITFPKASQREHEVTTFKETMLKKVRTAASFMRGQLLLTVAKRVL